MPYLHLQTAAAPFFYAIRPYSHLIVRVMATYTISILLLVLDFFATMDTMSQVVFHFIMARKAMILRKKSCAGHVYEAGIRMKFL